MWKLPHDQNDRNKHMTLAFLMLFLSTTLAFEDFTMEDDIFHKRPQRFSFGLGKRSSVTVEPLDHLKLLKLKQLLRGYWGRSGPHGLFKRSAETPVEDVQNDADTLLGKLGWWGLAGPHGLFKKSMVIGEENEEPIKRGAYSFGLGKRSSGQYSFGLGKRSQQFSFGLGKRGQQFSFGLGK